MTVRPIDALIDVWTERESREANNEREGEKKRESEWGVWRAGEMLGARKASSKGGREEGRKRRPIKRDRGRKGKFR